MKKIFKFISPIIIFMLVLCLAMCLRKDRLDINTANKTQLMELYGIGEVRAELIIQNRNEPYQNIEDVADRTNIPLELLKQYGTQIEFK